MTDRRDSSSRRDERGRIEGHATSKLVTLFLDRCGATGSSPTDAIEQYVERLRRHVAGSSRGTLDRWREARKVAPPELVPDLDAEGEIRPLGTRWTDGFAMRIKAQLPAVRRRFTEAHEICHTFFYELVPEIKFAPHFTDPEEERLCNHGAAALLLPANDVRAHAAHGAVSLSALAELASEWGVALSTMFFRLRQLGLWQCRLSLWHRTVSGDFVARETYGWLKGECRWAHEGVLEQAWSKRGPGSLTGSTFILNEDPNGISYACPVFYEVERRGDIIVALMSRHDIWRGGGNPGLFSRAPGRSSSR